MHIGKRSGAGGGLCSFSLQGHQEGPLDARIVTWNQWRALISLVCQQGGKVEDEYRREYAADEFIAEVEQTTVENRRRQYDLLRDDGYPVLPEGALPGSDFRGDWLCPSGFSFSFVDFF